MIETANRSVTLTTTGVMQVSLAGKPLQFSSRKALAILTYLALQSARSESRERIATMLWSDSGPDQARGALRQTLRRLKQDLGPAGELLEADRNTVRLTYPIDCDILEAIAEAEQGIPPGFLARDDGAFARLFTDIEDLDPDFNLWIAVQRERLGSQLTNRLESAMASAREADRQLSLAEALMRTDPTHEGACRAAMEAHVALGDTVQAMRVYERLWKILEEELDVEPSEKTQALYVAIKQGQSGAAMGGGPSGTQDFLAPIAILVEPIQGQRMEGDFDFFGSIFRDEMIAALARFRDWLVVDGEQGGSTPPTYRTYSLRIMLHPISDSVMVGLRLLDQADNHCVWAERYSVTLDGIAELHRSALRQLAVALNVHLSTPRLQSARETQSPMGRKYELWMQAQALSGDWRPETEIKAERILRELIETTPNFAAAMVALAQSLNSRPVIFPGYMRNPQMIADSLELTARAVKLDPLDSRTHLSRAWAHTMAGSYTAALSHLDMAMDLNENDPWTIISAGLGYAFAGQNARAADLIAQARQFGMRHSRAAQGYIATATYLVGDYEGSISAAEVAGDAIINLPAWAAASSMHLGDTRRAASEIATFLDLARGAWIGAAAPTDGAIIDWFVASFPIRSSSCRAELQKRLLAALGAAKERRPD
ncbi:BTAD domain-containing putative transcriptional regulator [Rhodobacteraceae bacterium DSL-40]|uniref:BTAD domain-containing putative transcriptional regulator n=1 Tax=Amaricoccus sp. B4 TaxID=3368557 RepID=UPI000DAF00B1